MKQPKKLTRAQKMILTEHKLRAENWMLKEEDNISLTVVNKKSGKIKVIFKE